MSKITRRDFIKLSTAASATAAVSVFQPDEAPAAIHETIQPDKWVYSTCGYCSTGCGMFLGVKDGKIVTVRGNEDHPVNHGKLCPKGIYEHKVVHTEDRLTTPLIRNNRDGEFATATWDEALELFTKKITSYDPQEIGVVSTGQLLTEEYYTLCKVVRAGIKTPHFDGNTTLCMASAVAGYIKSFGSDGPPGCYEDFEHAEVLLFMGSNLSEQHPIIYYRLQRALDKNRPKLIVVDPRKTQIARIADKYLPINPGTDSMFLNGIIRIIINEGFVDNYMITAHTEGYEALKSHVQQFTPDVVSSYTGLSEQDIFEVARLFGKAKTAMTCWTMGINQSVDGANAVRNINNLHLITGKIGKPGCAPFSITGQCNAMGGRELDGKWKGLPGYRALKKARFREEVASFWGVEPGIFPEKPGLSCTEIFDAAREGKIKCIWLIAHNVCSSLPDRLNVIKALKKLDFLVVQDVYHPTETTAYADMVLPAAMWGEKTGVMTNCERRVNLLRRAVNPPGDAKSDFEIFKEIGKRLGIGRLVNYKDTEEVFKEMIQLTKGRPCDYSGINYGMLEAQGGIQWPAPEGKTEGTKRMYTDGIFNTSDGKARIICVGDNPLPEPPDIDYPFILNTGRVIEHWHTGTKTRKVPELNALLPTAYVEINSVDASRLKIKYGDKVEISSRRGKVVTWARVTTCIKRGSVFMPFFDSNMPTNNLTLNVIDKISSEPNYKQAAVNVRKLEDAKT